MNLDPPVIKVFRLKKSKSPLAAIYGTLLVVATLACLYATVYVVVDGAFAMLVLTLPAGLLFGVATWAILEEYTSKLVIESDRFVYSNVFGTWRIDFGETKGYRVYFMDVINKADRTLEIHPAAAKGKIIVLHDNDINDFGVLVDWLKGNFQNVNSLTRAEETKEMMANPAYGGNEAEKKLFIEKARTVSYLVNVVGVIATALLFIVDLSLPTVAGAILVLPLCVIVVVRFKGIIYYNNKTESPHPYVALGLLAVSFGLFGKGIFMSFDLVSYSSVPWWTITFIALGFGSVILLTTREFANWTSMDIGNVGAIFFALWLMSLGSFFITNQVLDKSLPAEIITTVTGKSTGKDGDIYYVDFEPAGVVTDKQAEVDAEDYGKIEKGDTIVLQVFPGRWRSEWYTVGIKKE